MQRKRLFRDGFNSLTDREQHTAGRHPAPEGDGVHTTAKPQTVEQFVVLKHLRLQLFGVSRTGRVLSIAYIY